MASLHIISANGAGSHVFKGMFGTITPVENDPRSVMFKFAPGIVACSTSLSALSVGSGVKLKLSEVTTIEASEGAINAIKATLAKCMLHKWEQGYAALSGKFTPSDDDIVRDAETLVAIPGLGTVSKSLLSQSLDVEREIAQRGIENMINSIPNVAPYWMQIKSKQMWVGNNLEGDKVITGPAHISNIDIEALPVPMAGWSDQEKPYKPMNPNDGVDGWFDAKRAIPVYLPVESLGIVHRLARAVGFAAADEGSISPQQKALFEETMGLIQTTYVLRDLVIDNAQFSVVDGSTLVAAEPPYQPDELSDDDDSDDDEQENRHDRERG